MIRGQRRERAPQLLRAWFVGVSPDHRPRGFWLLAFFATVAVILGGRLVDVQVRQGHDLSGRAAALHAFEATVHAHRGRILDRTGAVLASDTQLWDIYADPGIISGDERQQVAEQLAPLMGIGPGRIVEMMSVPGRFVYLAKRAPDALKQKVEALRLRGVGVIPEEQRIYASSPVSGQSFAAQYVGYVDNAGKGQYGLEQYYDTILHGQDGTVSTLRDVGGNSIVVSHDQGRPAQDGSDLMLGLDPGVQYTAEQYLARAVGDSQSASGSILIMDTHTGAIRASANYPSYDANHYGQSDIANFTDANVAGLYEPGSVLKVPTFAGGLETAAIAPETQIIEGPTTIDGFTIHDWDNRAHGHVTMQEVLDQSLNNGAIQVMQKMGRDAYYRTLVGFGIGAPTGVDLAGEANRALKPQRQWTAADYATASFGQSVQATPIEILAAINAVANGGLWVQPHAVEETVDPGSGAHTAAKPVTRRVISAQTAAILTQMMTGVVENSDGSGFLTRMAAFKGQIAGKTGTASLAVNGKYDGDTICSFVGFLPADHPNFTMLVVLRQPHNPNQSHEGAILAAPVWRDLAKQMIDEWKITP